MPDLHPAVHFATYSEGNERKIAKRIVKVKETINAKLTE